MTPELVLELVSAGVGATGTGAGGVLLERAHRRRRYARTLANIDRLERELDIGQPPPAFQPRDYGQSFRASSREYVEKFSTGGPYRALHEEPPPEARGYQGPELTDADVRRLEHPDEFPA